MQKAITLYVGLLLLGGCIQQSSMSQIIAKGCSDEGLVGKKLNECVAAETAKYESTKTKSQRAEARANIDANKAKCRDYGFKLGTDKFISCMQQVEAYSRQSQARQQAMQSFQADLRQCNFARSTDSGTNSGSDGLARLNASLSCSSAQSKALELGLDTSTTNNLLQLTQPPSPPKPAPAQLPRTVDCDRSRTGFSCTQW